MKGLIIKDLLNLKKALLLYALMLVFYGVFSIAQGSNVLFCYFVVLLTMLMTINSMSYDEKANWDRYALTMPVSRKTLVIEKYVLCYGCLATALILAVLYIYITDGAITKDGLMILGVCACFSMFINAIILPAMFKLGCEKGRIVVFAICMIPSLIVIIFNKTNRLPLLNNKLLDMLPFIAGFGIVLMSILSIILSIQIYKKKEF